LFKYVVDGDKSDALASFVYNDPDRDLSGCLSQAASASTAEWLKNYDVREPMPDIRGQTSMDETQFHALYRMLTKELCIVQGPPGTGKTFTSVEAIRIMLANQAPADPPIIVAAQTNHALDQLLGLCLDVGARIVRVGGRTESERIEEHTIFNARQQVRSNVESFFKALDARRSRACTAMIELTEKVFNETLLQPADLLNADVITKEQHDSLIDDEMEGTEKHSLHGPFSLWLSGDCIEADVVRNKYCDDKKLTGDDEEFNQQEYEFEDDFENLAEEDEDKDRIHGTFIPFSYKWTGTEPAHLSSGHKRVVRELNKADLYAIPKYLRGAVYRLLIDRYIEKLRPQLLQCFADYIQCCKEGKMYRWMRDVNVVKQLQVNVVGCTTTGLTKYRGFLAALGAKTMLVEEAAETRESNITSALYPSIQQLILVGDHMQLAPSCDVRWLGQKPYYLGMSMFERMVAHVHLPYIMLDKQRRMAPEIRAVMDHFYDGLVDHPVVLRRDPVPGMGDRRTWLFAHKWEDAVDANHSRYNAEEATMVVNFFAYLVNNGIKEKQITVLTFYNAQRRMILKKLNTHPSLGAKEEPYHVHTVDSYQGEENDIVLLSLVRSPAAHREYAVGFLDNRNRVIVAISRARRGFYMFGNMVNASKASVASGEIWNPIWHAFIDQGSYDRARGLPLQCQPHGKTIWIKNTDGWTDNTGGCDQRCNFVRECGHTCPFPCHV
jgi:helicase required for RNAi-mediated heterochromatin assembly 1